VIHARKAQKLGQFAHAAMEFERLATEFSRLSDIEASVKCLLTAAFDNFASGRLGQALLLTERAYRLSVHKRQRIECLVVLGNLHSEKCDWDRAVEYLETAVAQVDDTERTAVEARVGVSRSKIFCYRGSFHTAARWARKSVQSNGIPRVLLAGALNQACAATTLVGEYDEAIAYGRLGLNIATDYSLVFLQSCLQINIGDALIGAGRIREGVAALRAAEQLSERTGNTSHASWTSDLLADLYRRNGNLQRMIELRKRTLEVLGAPGEHPIDHVRGKANLGFDLAILRKHAEAVALLESVLTDSQRKELHSITIPVYLYMGWLKALHGDETSARSYLTQAVRGIFSSHQLHFVLQEARCATPILGLCKRYGLAGDIDSFIVPRLPSALRAYYRSLSEGSTYPTDVPLGSPRLSRMQLAKRATAPHNEANAMQTQLRTLTTRELEVLKLLSLGLPNKAIATRLFITEKTVKTHTNHIFKKLSVTNRVQAGILLREYQTAC
jgi:ATP/maltotriose-dependent transcriptional regulator MalT